MRITSTDKVEDCFDGSVVFRYYFAEAWTEETIRGLEEMGETEYFPDFPRPFFRLRTPSGMEVKGVEGEDNCLVILPRAGREFAKAMFEARFSRTEPADKD